MAIRTTIVTALFDIERDKWNKYNASYDGYLNQMKNMLSIDSPMVVFTQEKFFKKIFDMRSEIDPKMNKTKIIVRDLESSTTDRLWGDRIRKVMSSSEFKKEVAFPDVPEMSKPMYNILMYSKVYWISQAIDMSAFRTANYMWLDAGCFREIGDGYKKYMIKWPNVQINKPTFFCHHDKINIHDKKNHVLSQMRFIHGGCFIIPKKYFQEFKTNFELTLDYILKNNYIGSDEKLLDLVFLHNTSTYELIKSGWREYFERLL